MFVNIDNVVYFSEDNFGHHSVNCLSTRVRQMKLFIEMKYDFYLTTDVRLNLALHKTSEKRIKMW
jgi:hypothetical protein